MTVCKIVIGTVLLFTMGLVSPAAYAQDTIAIDFLLCDDGVSPWPDCPDSAEAPDQGKPAKRSSAGGLPVCHDQLDEMERELQTVYDDRDDAYEKVYALVDALEEVYAELNAAKLVSSGAKNDQYSPDTQQDDSSNKPGDPDNYSPVTDVDVTLSGGPGICPCLSGDAFCPDDSACGTCCDSIGNDPGGD